MKFAHKSERKGATEQWVIEKIIEDINRLGYTEVVLKGDGERALQEVLKRLKSCGIIQSFFKDLLRTIPKQMVQQRRHCRSTWDS